MLLVALLGGGCGPAHPAPSPASRTATIVEPATVASHVRGLWVWGAAARLAEADGASTLLATCEELGITEVYLGVTERVLADARLPDLMSALAHQGIRVEALMGDAVWYRPESRPSMIALIERVAAYNARFPSARFEGLHLDVEPHQIPENKASRGWVPALVETLREADTAGARHGLEVSADLPRFILQGPHRKEIARAVARVFVMLYELRDRSEGALAEASQRVLRDVFDANPAERGRIVVGLQATDYPSDLAQMLRVVDGANGPSAHYGGWAVHDESSFRSLRSRAAKPESGR